MYTEKKPVTQAPTMLPTLRRLSDQPLEAGFHLKALLRLSTSVYLAGYSIASFRKETSRQPLEEALTMPHTHRGAKSIGLHEAILKIAELQAEIARLHKALSSTRRMYATSSGKVIPAGFGRDWSQGYSNPVLSVPSHELYQEEQLSA
jgi:hypothetical protein